MNNKILNYIDLVLLHYSVWLHVAAHQIPATSDKLSTIFHTARFSLSQILVSILPLLVLL